MKLDEIKERLMKMKALANAGVGGERANAEKLLADIAARYGISLEELNGEEIEKHAVKFTQLWQRKLLSQLAAIMRQEKRKHSEVLRDKELVLLRVCYGKSCKVTEYFLYATKCDWLELTAKFDLLKADYKRQQKKFFLAFLIANDLLTDPDDDTPEPTYDDIKAYADAAFMSIGIKKSNTNKQLENKIGFSHD